MVIEDDEEKDEMTKLLGGIQKTLAKDKDKMSQAMLTALSNLSDAIEDMGKAHKESTYFDKNLGSELSKSITEALGKMTEAVNAGTQEMSNNKIDLSPIAKANELIAKSNEKNTQHILSALLDLQAQNREFVKAITGLQKEAPKDDRVMLESLRTMASTIVSSNDATLSAIKAIIESQPKPDNKPKKFKHKVNYREGGKIESVDSTEVV